MEPSLTKTSEVAEEGCYVAACRPISVKVRAETRESSGRFAVNAGGGNKGPRSLPS